MSYRELFGVLEGLRGSEKSSFADQSRSRKDMAKRKREERSGQPTTKSKKAAKKGSSKEEAKEKVEDQPSTSTAVSNEPMSAAGSDSIAPTTFPGLHQAPMESDSDSDSDYQPPDTLSESEDEESGEEEIGDEESGDEEGSEENMSGSDQQPQQPSGEQSLSQANQRSSGSQKRVLDPNSDDDPEEANSSDEEYPTDEFGWTRRLTKVKKHKFKGRALYGPTFNSENYQEIDFFYEFFPLLLILRVVDWTNVKLNAAGKPPTSAAEVKAWLGLRLVMSLSKASSTGKYWSSERGWKNDLVISTMKKNRFEELSQYLACHNPETSPDDWPQTTSEERGRRYTYMKEHPVYPVQELWDIVASNCRTKWNPLADLAIDEAMIKYKGFKATAQKVFMPLKPIRSGFKVYSLAESATGFMLFFEVHPRAPHRMLDTSLSICRHFTGKYHHIYCDKLYTSVPFARELLEKRTYLTGAISMNARGLPADLSPNPNKNPSNYQSIKKMKKTPRGTFYVRQNGKLTYTLWRDSSVMSILSTGHNGFRSATDFLTRTYKDENERVRTSKQVRAPPAAISYTSCMGGVDRADQLRANYTITRKSQKWWMQLLYFIIDVSRVNAFISYKVSSSTFDPEEPLEPHADFIMELAKQLIDGYSGGSTTRRQNTAAAPVPARHAAGHKCIRMPTKWPKQCVWCKHTNATTPAGKLRVTRTGCNLCMVHLCKVGCFASSPHLIEVRERIRVNGKPLDYDKFASYFSEVFGHLEETKEAFGGEMPLYNRILCVLGFYTFLKEKVDVAVIEVGLGGEYDVTNFIHEPIVTGISSLGMDHITSLGDTIAKIAWHKAGILKPGRPAFTVPQPEDAMKVILDRAKEIGDTHPPSKKLKVAEEESKSDLSNGSSLGMTTSEPLVLPDEFISGLRECYWPGRSQTIVQDNVTYYVDGAHTRRSIESCVEWFLEASDKEAAALNGSTVKMLVFNLKAQKYKPSLIRPLLGCNFVGAAFCPSYIYEGDNPGDLTFAYKARDIELRKSQDIKQKFEDFQATLRKTSCDAPSETTLREATAEEGNMNNSNQSTQKDVEKQVLNLDSSNLPMKNPTKVVKCVALPSISCALRWASAGKDNTMGLPGEDTFPIPEAALKADRIQVLVTGSLYLVGGALTLLDPGLATK
ncbi:Folylpolyglutamate synthase, mitochondrial [Holothuria leucospilota]|uniref:tetrahydrofolate synthase n=1 Tax=Holothuria leucospilota TaxID=206669 RepID=A0A9Q1H9S2_HOLLE|nr:Folylpolyglutamate synthase, mitochondrial [Holothuria leucospilota]